VSPMEAFMAVVHEESRQKLMTPTIVKEGAVAAVATAKNAQPASIERMCDYCHKKGHIRDTCWDLHGRPSGGRGWTGRGSGRRGGGRNGGLRRTQQAYASDKVPDDGASASESTMEDMVAQLTSQMTALQARLSGSSFGAEGYHSLSLSLPSPVIKSVNAIQRLATKSNIDKT
jgi:hypothetical protein